MFLFDLFYGFSYSTALVDTLIGALMAGKPGFAAKETADQTRPFNMRPLKNALFYSISVSGSNFNPRNTRCMSVVKIFAFLDLEQN